MSTLGIDGAAVARQRELINESPTPRPQIFPRLFAYVFTIAGILGLVAFALMFAVGMTGSFAVKTADIEELAGFGLAFTTCGFVIFLLTEIEANTRRR